MSEKTENYYSQMKIENYADEAQFMAFSVGPIVILNLTLLQLIKLRLGKLRREFAETILNSIKDFLIFILGSDTF